VGADPSLQSTTRRQTLKLRVMTERCGAAVPVDLIVINRPIESRCLGANQRQTQPLGICALAERFEAISKCMFNGFARSRSLPRLISTTLPGGV
jgi:hypothetical protein